MAKTVKRVEIVDTGLTKRQWKRFDALVYKECVGTITPKEYIELEKLNSKRN